MPDNATNKVINASVVDSTIATVAKVSDTIYRVTFVKTGTTSLSLASADGNVNKSVAITTN